MFNEAEPEATGEPPDLNETGSPAPAEFVLRWADNALIQSQRLAEWTGHGPVLEEDIALANIALDLLGQARLLLGHAGSLMQPQRSEDELAFFRDAGAFRNFTALELPNSGVHAARGAQGDYAFTIVRHALFSAYMLAVWERLLGSRDATLAAIAGKAIKETSYHWRHASDWLIKLGDGTAESQQRMQQALEQFLPYTNEWFAFDALDLEQLEPQRRTPVQPQEALATLALAMREHWLRLLDPVMLEATLAWPARGSLQTRGRYGLHGEHLSVLLAEMQSVARAHPGAKW